jgi:hypothetical protein
VLAQSVIPSQNHAHFASAEQVVRYCFGVSSHMASVVQTQSALVCDTGLIRDSVEPALVSLAAEATVRSTGVV